ncbi:alpha/beta hydrolase [Streptomyces glaucescens]|uniref:Protease n=1 Tax=Streptomyces glaucescens TaxID=1907 RepID=A0A089X6A2_STRGA|nr:alpha/beta hydrolase [Streptomyces glaucescens]AIR96609.1 protease [Streptomyces glaucescens]
MPAQSSTRPAPRRRALVGALAVTLLSAGLPAAAADDGGQPDLSRFYRQTVSWGRCEGADMPKDLQCGKVTVPLDYARPETGTLELALARHRASGDRRGSIVLNFGGPGGPGVAGLAAGGRAYLDLTDGYDVVGFDPRGVGRSSPVSCGDTYGTEPPPEGADDADEVLRDPRELLDRLRAEAEACAKHSGPVLAHIGTVNVSRDLDVIRQALGDRKLNYLGFSYGTRLGAVYAKQFPDRVGRLALDGVDTLTEPLTEQGIATARGQQTALDDFLDWCARDIACPFGQDPRRAREDMRRLVRSLDENPVPTDFGYEFGGQDLVGAIGQALYSKELWPSLERALASLMEDGDTRHIEAFTSGGHRFPDGREQTGRRAGGPEAGGGLADEEDIPLDNLVAALTAVNCADDPDRPTAGQIERDLGRLRAAYERASPVFGRYRLTEALMCYGRPRGTDFIRDEVKDVDSPKLLLVGTRGDPATPYRWTEQTARRLGPSAVVLDNKGDGHTGYGSSKCVHRKIDDFLLYGRLPANGSSCGAEDGE